MVTRDMAARVAAIHVFMIELVACEVWAMLGIVPMKLTGIVSGTIHGTLF